MEPEKIFAIPVTGVYRAYLKKVECKDKSKREVNHWLNLRRKNRRDSRPPHVEDPLHG